ncbi:MAG TPA: ABC transporter ATP-binding protein [Planctomycetota bacterium]|jgi:putative ABC transport system ATP-binding protein|nr:ABC transporter ATP-binding protein [Planctomycetota bacterium]MDP7245021.1 ABC transporter ATP-binding protein [Planctomycetota bacterium]HJM40087.1 ABC transporter ATP-binding protein [Planctomycetota bacterium]|tara:strand:- start:18678 stop:19328 length:651 start_codon:yes stop_codon:yes gene_type:complete
MIRLSQVRKTFQREGVALPVLSIDELQILAGERVALVGASGSGKTTLLNLVSGLVLPESGSIEIDGTDICQLSEHARDRFRADNCGCMFQSFHLLDGFSALENIELGASFTGRKPDREHVLELLESLGLSDRAEHYPSQLSVGQQARVALARALVNRPKVVLADEPTGALDPQTSDSIFDLLLTTAENESITVICATHNESLASRLDRTLRVEDWK